MPKDPLPISNYVDPNWYNDLRNFNNGSYGPVRPESYISPLGERTFIAEGETGRLSEPNFDAVRSIQDRVPLEDANALIENRALQTQQREKFSTKNFITRLFPKEYSYTTDIKKLKDRMVLVLYSPNSSSNPGFNKDNRDQKLATDIIDLTSNLLKDGGSFVQGISDALGVGEVTEQFGKFISKGTDSVKKVLSSEALFEAKQKFDTLNESFYDRGGQGNRYKIVYLPLPKGQLTDSHSHTLNGIAMNPIMPLMGIASTVLDKLIPGGSSTGANKGAGQRGYAIPAVGDYLIKAAQLNSRKAINPAQETLYQSPVPRQWQFTFTYTPSSKEEAEKFIEIINILKEHSYPTVDAEAVIFNFPGTVDFYFVINSMIDENGDIDENRPANKVLPKSLHPCFIKSVQVDYISDTGFYSHFYDGNPTSMNLTIELVESKLLTREDLDPYISGSSQDLTPEQKKELLQNPPPAYGDNARIT